LGTFWKTGGFAGPKSPPGVGTAGAGLFCAEAVETQPQASKIKTCFMNTIHPQYSQVPAGKNSPSRLPSSTFAPFAVEIHHVAKESWREISFPAS
jgi:hypothetical protein